MKHSKLYSIVVALIVSIGGLLLGLSANVSGAIEFFKVEFELSEGSLLLGLATGSAMLGCFVGNFNAGMISDKLGRKKALMLSAFLFLFCTLGSGLCSNYTVFLITRFIGGLGIGISLLAAPLYISEFAPDKDRGFLVSFNQLNIVIGFSIAFFANYIIGKIFPDNSINWRYMLEFGSIFAIAYFILLFFVPESPRWLIINGKDEEAKKIMKKVGGEAHAVLAYQAIKDSLSSASPNGEKSSYSKTWGFLFSGKMKLVLIVGLSVAFFQQISGINAVLFFAPTIFKMTGGGANAALQQAVIIGLINVGATIGAMFFIDRLGRKPLLYIGVSIIAISLLISAIKFRSAIYEVKTETIANIANSVITDAAGEAKNAKAVNITSAASAQQESDLIKSILAPMENKSYNNEVEFFNTIKAGINAAVKVQVDKALAGQLTESDAFYAPINKKIAKGEKDPKVIFDIVSGIKYSYYKSKVLESSITIDKIWVLIAIIGFVVGFAISLGPITWALLSEIFPSHVRGLGISIAGTLNGITSFVVATLFPAELEFLGTSNTFFIYAGFMIVCLIMVAKFYPETKGKSLEQIEAEMVK